MSTRSKGPIARWPVLPGSPFAPVRDRIASWSPADLAAVREEGESLELEIGALLAGGATPGSAAVQRAIEGWAIHVGRFLPLTPRLFLAIGRHYVTQPAIRARYEAIEPGLAAFMRDAIRIYCRRSRTRAGAAPGDVGTGLH
jgi:MerR family transcriptional regulator, thiopeptide resistance regulator